MVGAKGGSCRVDRENTLSCLPSPPLSAVRRRLGRREVVAVAGLLEARRFWSARLRGFKRNGRRAQRAGVHQSPLASQTFLSQNGYGRVPCQLMINYLFINYYKVLINS